MSVPRVVIAGTHSGAGKTTVATGIMAALRARGRVVAPFKVGPDFIDPSYHELATGRPGRNLDTWMCGPDLAIPLFLHGAAGADIAVVEGVMGLFDGASGEGETGSTAQIAKLLATPVVLVVDAASIARSVGAVVHGFRTFDREVSVGGVILNRVASTDHLDALQEALAEIGVPVLGWLPRDKNVRFRERHLGLVPVVERRTNTGVALRRLADVVATHVDLDAIEALAAAALPMVGRPWDAGAAVASLQADMPPRPQGGVAIAVATGPAFSFYYRENLELLEAAGAGIVPFDPREASALPAGVRGVYLGGGFPETYAVELAANEPLRRSVAAAVRRGCVTYAECGGLLYLCRSLDGRPMAGALDLAARMTSTLRLGYAEGRALADSPIAARGDLVRGHVFHYSEVVDETGVGDVPFGRRPLWRLRGRRVQGEDGTATHRLAAGYLHLHFAADPIRAVRLVATVATARPTEGAD